MKKKLLIVDDEWNMRNLLRIHLTKDFDITEAVDGEEAVSLIKKSSLDLIILDVMMPGLDGMEVCKEVRKVKKTPILMLTARNDTKDKVHGLEMGADDYLVKPFEPDELLARVKALLRRSALSSETSEKEGKGALNYGNGFMEIDQEGHSVFIAGEKLELTPKEYKLLHVIASNPKRVFTRDVLLDILWGYNDSRDTRTVDSHVKNIRIKIKEKGFDYNPFETVWGVGYKFREPDEQL
ncbi:response regulator transcription factor [Domibacillus enclensis]|uniref:DNA-binding response regulator n=1 Tax=Domibacillus enclensis TaxID=1017273 RepID=A0A1N6VZ78_9BACI|nr:response regulator transcription factor [Domibacillus enclensis]OXS77804.1 DNA-binding response regulator [Domibacillus enclensis]SIQ83124.1 two-component system, OmpR family, response regulator ResD [Domibacillus enclensis]